MKTTVHNPELARFVEAGTLYLGAPRPPNWCAATA
jgi:hypothetical protein